MKKIITIFTFLGAIALFTNNSYAGYFNNAPINTCDEQITSYLSFGSSGDEVSILQGLLSNEGYLSAYPNGHFGSATKAALKGFQRDNGLSVTGTVGPSTQDAINERLCDNNLSTSNYYNNSYSYNNNSSVTYVDPFDPYVKVVSPSDNGTVITYGTNYGTYTTPNSAGSISVTPLVPATVNSSLTQANIIYNPLVGYTYALAPSAGSLTISSPGSNSSFHEGDTVNLNWYTNNITAVQYVISLENISSGRTWDIKLVSGNSDSFVLTKEMLDYVCAGVCGQYSQSKFNIVVSTPIKDMIGNVNMFKARVSDVTIIRPYYSINNINLTSNKTPVDSGESFRIYGNNLNQAYYNYGYTQDLPYSYGISANCLAGVTVSIGGLGCGQEFVMPQSGNYLQRGIPVTATNNTWFTQSVVFNLTSYNQAGQIIGFASTSVQVNPVSRVW